jgi:hypothetical protein
MVRAFCTNSSRKIITHKKRIVVQTNKNSPVGYGDDVPRTASGRFVGVAAIFTGILIIAVPLAIIAREIHEVYDEYKERKQRTARNKERQQQFLSTAKKKAKDQLKDMIDELEAEQVD